jgi:hypothetical protein
MTMHPGRSVTDRVLSIWTIDTVASVLGGYVSSWTVAGAIHANRQHTITG